MFSTNVARKMLLYPFLFSLGACWLKWIHLSKLTARQNYIMNIFYLWLNKNLATSGLLQLPKIIQNKFFFDMPNYVIPCLTVLLIQHSEENNKTITE